MNQIKILTMATLSVSGGSSSPFLLRPRPLLLEVEGRLVSRLASATTKSSAGEASRSDTPRESGDHRSHSSNTYLRDRLTHSSDSSETVLESSVAS